MIRSSRPALAIVAATMIGACTEPAPKSDAGDYPYRRSSTGVRLFGTSRILVIPAKFAGGAAEPMSGGAIRAGYFGGPGGGPVAAEFALASGNRFTLVGEVTDWVQTTIRGSELATREGSYIYQAIHSVDSLVDFGRYDNDGPDGFPNSGDDDGLVDGGIVVLNSDRNITCGIPGAGGLHPHAFTKWRDSSGAAIPTQDPRVYRSQDASVKDPFIRVGGYVAMGALSCGADVGANVMSHELGHLLLGLPDMYHVVGGGTQLWEARRWVVGCWELMAAGSGWGCGTGVPPTNGRIVSTLGAWTRARLGWADPINVRIDRDSTYTLWAPQHGGTVLRVPVADSEYFLVEYREKTLVDVTPPANGVLIYHVDERLPMFPVAAGARKYRVRLVEADDNGELLKIEGEGGDRGGAGDAFGVTRTTFATGSHSDAVTTSGGPLPFSITEIAIDLANHRATLRIKPF